MSKVSITRTHNMNRENLRAEVEEMAAQLVERHGGDYSWAGDQLTYKYSGGVTANVHCEDDRVRVDVSFGMLMSMLKGPISREIEQYLDKRLS